MDSHNDDISEVYIPPTALNSTVVLGYEGNERRCISTIPELQK